MTDCTSHLREALDASTPEAALEAAIDGVIEATVYRETADTFYKSGADTALEDAKQKIRALAQAGQPQEGWRADIENVPKDGRLFLTHDADGDINMVFWNGPEILTVSDCVQVEPVHWMLIPAPPSGAAGKE